MKLQISYNLLDLSKTLDVANQTAPYASILGVGSLTLLQNGVKAISTFKEKFPSKEIFAEVNIIERGDLSVKILAQAGATYISVLAGSSISSLKKATEAGRDYGAKIMINLLDAVSLEQSAADAKTLGAHGIIFHLTSTIKETIGLDAAWQSVRGNTTLPIFVTGSITRETISHLVPHKPEVIMIGKAITQAENPAEEAQHFNTLISSL